MEFRVIAIDFDGVIANLPIDWKSVRNKVSKVVGYKVESIVDFYKKNYGTDVFWRVSEFIKKVELEAILKARLNEPVLELMRKAKALGIPVYIVTLQCREAVLKFMNSYNLTGLVKKVINREDFGGKSDMLRYIVNLEGVLPSQVLFIDDMARNIEECRAVGAYCIKLKGYDRKSIEAVIRMLKNQT